jgi:hypothetical protein
VTENCRSNLRSGYLKSYCREVDKVRSLTVWVTMILAAAAAVAVGVGGMLAVGREDTEALESPLVLAIARQLDHGPWELYGPFDARNHLVIIHAPLYYHVSALGAWLFYRLGINQVDAALAAGRSVSLMGLFVTVGAAYCLCRIDGAARRAGWWAILLFAASRVVGVFPFTVRPDLLGVAFQTVGVGLVLSVLRSDAPKGWMLPAGYAVFGLAVCVKQHLIIGPLVSTALALLAWRRGRLPLKLIERSVLTGLAVPLTFYGIEELATGSRMSQAVFHAAAAASRVHGGGWFRAYLLMFTITGRNSGIAMLVIAAGVAGLANRSGWVWKGLAIAGTSLIGVFLARSVWDLAGERLLEVVHGWVGPSLAPGVWEEWLGAEGGWERVLAFFTIAGTMFIVLPACVVLARPVLARRSLDRGLLLYLACELMLLFALGWSSTGSWANYGIPATVLASVLAARALDRVCTGSVSPRAAVPIVWAVLVVLVAVCSSERTSRESSRSERVAIEQIFDHFHRPRTEYFFVDRPGANRLNARLDLVYDHWLYPAFESVRLAEPRSVWLRRALVSGSVRFIVNTSEDPAIDGIAEPIPKLGYVRRVKNGPYCVWERIARGLAE